MFTKTYAKKTVLERPTACDCIRTFLWGMVWCTVSQSMWNEDRHLEGSGTALLDLLDAERVELQPEDAYAMSHLDSANDAVSLYKPLAGGWPQRHPQLLSSGRL